MGSYQRPFEMCLRLIVIFVILASLVKFTHGLQCFNCIETKSNSYGCLQTKFFDLKELAHDIDKIFVELFPEKLPLIYNDKKQKKPGVNKTPLEILNTSKPELTNDLPNLRNRKIDGPISGIQATFSNSKNVNFCQTVIIGDYTIRSGEQLNDVLYQCHTMTSDKGDKISKCWCTTDFCNDKGMANANNEVHFNTIQNDDEKANEQQQEDIARDEGGVIESDQKIDEVKKDRNVLINITAAVNHAVPKDAGWVVPFGEGLIAVNYIENNNKESKVNGQETVMTNDETKVVENTGKEDQPKENVKVKDQGKENIVVPKEKGTFVKQLKHYLKRAHSQGAVTSNNDTKVIENNENKGKDEKVKEIVMTNDKGKGLTVVAKEKGIFSFLKHYLKLARSQAAVMSSFGVVGLWTLSLTLLFV